MPLYRAEYCKNIAVVPHQSCTDKENLAIKWFPLPDRFPEEVF
jgi:hypothetical protein